MFYSMVVMMLMTTRSWNIDIEDHVAYCVDTAQIYINKIYMECIREWPDTDKSYIKMRWEETTTPDITNKSYADAEAAEYPRNYAYSSHFAMFVVVVVTLFSNIIHEQNTSNTNLTNKAYPRYCKYVFCWRPTEKALAYLAVV